MELVYITLALAGLFQLKHFLCDYIWQTEYMLGKMNTRGWKLPLYFHSKVHMLGTMTVILLLSSGLYLLNIITPEKAVSLLSLSIYLGLADLILHFWVDRIKASPNYGGRWSPTDKEFWWALGADQGTHHLINYVFILFILMEITNGS